MNSLLGLGLLTAMRGAAARHLVTPNVKVVPQAVRVQGALVDCRVALAGGFDLDDALRRFRWHPGLAPVDLSR